jgi:hypothetical protein
MIDNINDYMIERITSHINYLKNSPVHEEADYCEYIYNTFYDDSLLNECKEWLEAVINDEDEYGIKLIDIILYTIDIEYILETLRDEFDWHTLNYCDTCKIYWRDDDDEEHTCVDVEPLPPITIEECHDEDPV